MDRHAQNRRDKLTSGETHQDREADITRATPTPIENTSAETGPHLETSQHQKRHIATERDTVMLDKQTHISRETHQERYIHGRTDTTSPTRLDAPFT